MLDVLLNMRDIQYICQRKLPSLFFVALAYYFCFSKSEYVIYKLKEMGKIGEKDILQICNQFSKLDPNNSGKITLPDLFENRL